MADVDVAVLLQVDAVKAFQIHLEAKQDVQVVGVCVSWRLRLVDFYSEADCGTRIGVNQT